MFDWFRQLGAAQTYSWRQERGWLLNDGRKVRPCQILCKSH